ncbi:MAG: phosphoribosylanthranilate isomerase [Endomicrobiia bacterium]
MTKIKICGITNYEDAMYSVTLGADFLGFNFYSKSKRKISIDTAKEIISKLPDTFVPVGVFVDEEIDKIKEIVERCNLNMIQLHGKESPEYCNELKLKIENEKIKIIKAFRIKTEGTLKYIARYKNVADYFLLDTYVPEIEGGTGETFNWEIAIEVKKFNVPIFLAGGLTPENVKEAVMKVQPYAVDVASGVERFPRRKDYNKLRDFITIVRAK